MNESHGLPLRRALTACAFAAPPEFQPPRSKRRMSRAALVTFRRLSEHDKTRVSSINKRRVTSVPEEDAVSTGIRDPGARGSWSSLEVWTRRSPRVARPRSLPPDGGSGATPLHDRGCVDWLTTERLDCRPLSPCRGSDCPPTIAIPRRTDPRRPASQRTSPGSEPSVESIYRLIDGRGRAARVHRERSDPDSLRHLTNNCVFFWHAARRCDPRRPPSPLYACAPFRESPSTPEGEDERSTTRARGLGPP